MERYAFEKYYMHDLKEANDILEIVIAGCQRAKDFQMNIDCDLIIPWITPLLKKYPILKHIDERIVPNINELDVPKKDDLRLIFAKAIACLYFIKKMFLI